jgi:hypothetical protein
MIRRASSAWSGGTAIDTSTSPSTLNGNTEGAGPADGIDWMPCVSRRPRTIEASISECARKTMGQSMLVRTGNSYFTPSS